MQAPLTRARNNTREESVLFNQTEAGTPMGELLRRYWWPVGISADLKDKPTLVRLLSEDLVLYRDLSGKTGLVGALCPHRRANLVFGNTTQDGIRCRYHGWLINSDGSVLATPGEPDKSFKTSVKHPAYVTQEMGGLIFAYLGPQPAPALPPFNFLADPGERMVKITGYAECNWMPTIENAMDPLHLSFTHAPTFKDLRAEPEVWFEEHDLGVAYVSARPTPQDKSRYGVRVHNLLFPAISHSGNTDRWVENAAGSDDPPITARWAVPVDDTNTIMFRIMYRPENHQGEWRDCPEGERWDLPWEAARAKPFQEYRESQGQPTELGYTVPPGASREDATIVESIGAAIDHENENLLPTADLGLSMIRDLYLLAMKSVEAGEDPPGTFRDLAPGVVIKPKTGEQTVDAEEYQRLLERKDVASSLAY